MIAAIIQARTGSVRLPNKVLKKIKGNPVLWYVIKRVQQSKKIQDIVVATTSNKNDDIICDLCNLWNIKYFQGSENDVLDRYYQTAKFFNVDIIVRITADCPLIDFRVIDDVISLLTDNSLDFASNCLLPSFPDGMDVSVFSFKSLEIAWKNASLCFEREHVTPFIQNNSSYYNKSLFKAENYSFKTNFSHIRLTLDEKEDFDVIQFLIERTELDTSWLTYVALLTKYPEVLNMNAIYTRDEGYQSSLLEDKYTSKNDNRLSNNNKRMQDRAKKIIPGMTQLLSKRPDQFSYGVWPTYYSKAKGSYIWDLEKKCYLDMSIGGIGANILGYADEDVDKAVKTAISLGTSSSLNCPEEIELAELLCDIHPWADQVRYARTGGEAMAIAVRIARALTEKDKIAFCGYHGWHDWYLSANLNRINNLSKHLLPELNPLGVPKNLSDTVFPFRYNQIDDLIKIVNNYSSELAAIVMEPIRNEKPKDFFLQDVKKIARKHHLVLIFDEITSGFRMNSGGAHLLLDVIPDIAVFSKALGNGYPISAIIGKKNVMEVVQKTFISSTNWTERIGPTAALATIKKFIKIDAGKHLMAIGDKIQRNWKSIAKQNEIPIKVNFGIPSIGQFSFQVDNAMSLKALFVQLMLHKNILASNVFYAMAAHSFNNVDHYLSNFEDTFCELYKAISIDCVDKLLIGQPSNIGLNRLN